MKNVFLIITILLGFFIICKASSHTDTLCNYDSFNVYWGKSDINKKISILDTLNLLSFDKLHKYKNPINNIISMSMNEYYNTIKSKLLLEYFSYSVISLLIHVLYFFV